MTNNITPHFVRPVLSALLAVLALLPAGAFAAGKRPFTVDDLYRLGRVQEVAVSPDGKLLAFSVKRFDMAANKGTTNLFLSTLADGKVRQLTTAAAADTSPRFMPDGERLAFLSTRSGSSQVWAIPLSGGEAVQLTKLPMDVGGFAVAKDGRHLAVQAQVFPSCKDMACNEKRAKELEADPVKARTYDRLLYRVWDHWRDERRSHVLWVALDGTEPRDLTPGDIETPPFDLGGHLDLDISPEGDEVAFAANVTRNPAWNTNNDVFTVKVAGKAPVNVTLKNEACDAEPRYSPDGRYLAYLAMKRPGFESDSRVLTIVERKSGAATALTKALDASVEEFSWSPDSREIVFNVWERGRLMLYKAAVPSAIVTRVRAEHTASSPVVTSDGKSVVFIGQSMSEPTEVFSMSMSGGGERRISHVNDDVVAGIEMGAGEELEFEGAHGDKVHGFLLKPPGFDPKRKYPVLMLMHGGPQGSFGDDFHQRWNMQMFASPGFVVVSVNFHGSTGYGQAFTDAVSGDWGGAPYEDVMKGLDHVLAAFPFTDGKNVSAAGASYGGFMINWILGHTDRFRSLVSHDGVYDQVSMYGATEELWFPEWEMKGTPWGNPETYEKSSPSAFAGKFKTPTLVVHGEQDFRVPYTQGLQLFTALQRQGVESKLLFFPDENHFVQKPQNARLWWNTVLDWLADHAGIKRGKTAPAAQVKKIAGP